MCFHACLMNLQDFWKCDEFNYCFWILTNPIDVYDFWRIWTICFNFDESERCLWCLTHLDNSVEFWRMLTIVCFTTLEDVVWILTKLYYCLHFDDSKRRYYFCLVFFFFVLEFWLIRNTVLSFDEICWFLWVLTNSDSCLELWQIQMFFIYFCCFLQTYHMF